MSENEDIHLVLIKYTDEQDELNYAPYKAFRDVGKAIEAAGDEDLVRTIPLIK